MLSNLSSPPAGTPLIPLSMLGPGERGVVVDMRGGRGIRGRLSAMGLVPGVQVSVVNNGGNAGPLIVAIMDTRLALGRRMAHRILVQPL